MSEQTPQKGKNQIIRDWITSKLNENFDFAKKGRGFEQFLTENPTFTKDDRSSFWGLLGDTMTKAGKDPRAYGLKTSKPPKITNADNDMGGASNAKPQQAPQKKQPTLKKDSEQQSDSEKESEENQSPVWTHKNVSVTWKMIFNFPKYRYKHYEGLTDEEAEMMGDIWLNPFNKYLRGEKWLLGTAVLNTLALFGRKIGEAKAKEEEKKDGKTE